MGLRGRELLLDAIKGGVLTLALFLAYVTIPVVGLLPGFFAPLPGMYYYFKRGAAAGAAIFAIVTMVLVAMGDPTAALLYLVQCGLLAILIPLFYSQGKGVAKALAYSVSIDFLLIVALAVGYGLWAGIDLQDSILKGIQSSISQAIAVYEKQGLKGEDLQLLTQGMQQVGSWMARVFPALLLIAMASIAALNMMALFRIAGRLLPELPKPDNFQNFRNPELLVWVVIMAGFAMLLPFPEVTKVALNLLLVTGFIYFLQGLAVILAFFQKISVPGLVRVIFWLFLAFQPYMVLAIAVLGIFDIWGDFRNPREKNL